MLETWSKFKPEIFFYAALSYTFKFPTYSFFFFFFPGEERSNLSIVNDDPILYNKKTGTTKRNLQSVNFSSSWAIARLRPAALRYFKNTEIPNLFQNILETNELRRSFREVDFFCGNEGDCEEKTIISRIYVDFDRLKLTTCLLNIIKILSSHQPKFFPQVHLCRLLRKKAFDYVWKIKRRGELQGGTRLSQF